MWSRLVLLLSLSCVALAACGSSNRGPERHIAESDPEVLAGYEPWERKCILWIRAHCEKAMECGEVPNPECLDSDSQLLQSCRSDVEDCEKPDPASFADCGTRYASESCDDFCPGSVCLNFCFYSCLD